MSDRIWIMQNSIVAHDVLFLLFYSSAHASMQVRWESKALLYNFEFLFSGVQLVQTATYSTLDIHSPKTHSVGQTRQTTAETRRFQWIISRSCLRWSSKHKQIGDLKLTQLVVCAICKKKTVESASRGQVLVCCFFDFLIGFFYEVAIFRDTLFNLQHTHSGLFSGPTCSSASL